MSTTLSKTRRQQLLTGLKESGSGTPKPQLGGSPIHVRIDGDGVWEQIAKLQAAEAKQPKKGRDKNRKSKKKRKFTAATADRHELYQLSVQSPKEDAQFLARVYKRYRGKQARHFREDFCGTGLLASAWIRRNDANTAEGFDIDPDPLAWGVQNNYPKLGAAAERMLMHEADVREPSTKRPDVRCAQNFSYWIFTERAELLHYFRCAYEDLTDEGVFVIDLHGGPEAMEEMEEERDIEEGFTYVWDQVTYHPISGGLKAKIHFRFKDGTELRNAFKYKWRMWHLTELRDVLIEAGFSKVDCFWEGTDEDGESGNGVFRRATKGENCLSWIAYLAAVK